MDTAGTAEAFRSRFREEAREIISELETSLLELYERRSDAELVGRVFRAMHTLKGSGAMFGFDDLAAFTHDLETAFDEVRQGRLAVSAELVDLALAALDEIRAMVEGEGDGAAGSQEARAKILADVRRLTGSAGAAAAIVAEPASEPAGTAVSGPVSAWRIRFTPGPDLLRNGSDPLLLIRELGRLGRLTGRASLDALPPLRELDPERCYAAWEIELETAAGADAIRDVFIFVEDQCALEIEKLGEPHAAPAREPAAAPAAVCPGDVTARGLEEQRRNAGRRSYDHPENTTSLRVPAARVDQLVNLVGELVTVQARLSEVTARLDDAEAQGVSEEIERLTSALRESSMSMRMVPIRGTFERFRRLVHDLARTLGKDVELTIEGADTELDKTVIDQLGDPLMHLIRNSMDHGIEAPEVRAAAGKRASATIHLSARHAGGSVLIGVADDGAGIDAEEVRRRAIERGLTAADAALSEAEIFSFIFQAGFSTARQVTDISGRGVGLDVVRQRVESLRGSVSVASERGRGTSVTLRLPLTLAIIDGLLVTVGESAFVLPLAATLECIERSAQDSGAVGGAMTNVRGELVPTIRLREYFGMDGEPPEREQIMVVESGSGRCGLVIDNVLGNCQTVIRSLGRLYRHVQAVSGATILGNGTLALILDPQRLVQEAMRAQGIRGRPPSDRPAAAQTMRRRSAAIGAGAV